MARMHFAHAGLLFSSRLLDIKLFDFDIILW